MFFWKIRIYINIFCNYFVVYEKYITFFRNILRHQKQRYNILKVVFYFQVK